MAKNTIKKPTSLADLKPAPYNPRRIEPAALDGLKASVERFGDISGIVWNARSGHVVAGHQRLKALQERGAVFDADACAVLLGDRRFNVRVVDWDDQTEKAANVAANNPHIAGEFSDALQDVLDDLAGWEGFEDVRLDCLVDESVGADTNPEDHWIGMPEYENGDDGLKITITCDSEEDREEFVKTYGIIIDKKQSVTWSTRFPYRDRQDLESLRFK